MVGRILCAVMAVAVCGVTGNVFGYGQSEAEAQHAEACIMQDYAAIAQSDAESANTQAQNQKNGYTPYSGPPVESLANVREAYYQQMLSDNVDPSVIASELDAIDAEITAGDALLDEYVDLMYMGANGESGGEENLSDYGWYAFFGWWSAAYTKASSAYDNFSEAQGNYLQAKSKAEEAQGRYISARCLCGG